MSSAASARLLSLFSLPPSTPSFLQSFHCAYVESSLPYHGTLYCFPHHLCFLSTLVPLRPQKLVLPLRDVRQVRREKTLGVNTALSLHTDDKSYLFAAFLHRDRCYTWIEQQLSHSHRGGHFQADDELEEEVKERGAGQAARRGKRLNGKEGQEGEDEDEDGESAAAGDGGGDEGELAFASEDELGAENQEEGKRPGAQATAKGRGGGGRLRPRSAGHARVLSSSYRAGERFSAGIQRDGQGEADDGSGLSKRERVLQQTREKAQREAEIGMHSAAGGREGRDGGRMDRLKGAGEELISRLSPMNLVKTRERRTAQGRAGKRREQREEWERSSDSEGERQGEEVEADEAADEEEEEVARVRRSGRGGTRQGQAEEEREAEVSRDPLDDSSPDYIPPQPRTLYQPRTFSTADPLVTAIGVRFSSLSSALDTRNRRFIHEELVQRQGRFSVVQRRMVLFSDQLILAKVKGKGADERLSMKRQMSLDGMALDIRPLHLQRREGVDTKLPLPFRVLYLHKGRQAAVVLSTKDAGKRREWVKKIQLAVSRVRWVAAQEKGAALDWGWYQRIVRGSIHLAALDNSEVEVKEMIEREPSLVNERDQEGLSPLMVAAHVNHYRIIGLLLAHPCQVDLRDADGRTAVHIAAKLGYAESVAALLADRRVDSRSFHPRSGRLSVSSAIWMTALAHRGEYEDILRQLTQHCREHRWPSSALRSALLDQRDLEGRTLLELCTTLSLTDVLPILVHLGATLDLVSPTHYLTPLCLAAQQTDMESLITLIQLGGQPTWRHQASGVTALHCAASLEVASFLVAHGARASLKTREGARVTDVYADERQMQTLAQAEQLYLDRKPVETSEQRKHRPRTVAANGGHPLDQCALCKDGVGGLGGVMKRIGWCGRCGLIMCSGCLRQRLIFTSSGGDGGGGGGSGGVDEEEMAPSCPGCFNVEMYRVETAEKKQRRVERQRRAVEEAKQSLFTESGGINLDYLTQALTAVHISAHALPLADSRASTTLADHQMLGRMQISETISPATAVGPSPPSTASTSSPARRPSSSPVTSSSPRPASQPRPKSIGPGSTANLAGKAEQTVNYVSGGGRPAANTGGKRAPQLALNNLPVLEPTSSPPASGGAAPASRKKPTATAAAAIKGSQSMDGVNERLGKTKAGQGERKAADVVAAGDWVVVDSVMEGSGRATPPQLRSSRSTLAKAAGKGKKVTATANARLREEKEREEESESATPEAVDEEVAERPRMPVPAKRKGVRAALSVDVEDDEPAIRPAVKQRKQPSAPKPAAAAATRADDDWT